MKKKNSVFIVLIIFIAVIAISIGLSSKASNDSIEDVKTMEYDSAYYVEADDDAPEILTTVKEVFDPATFVLKGSFINEERLHLRLIETEMMDIEGEDLFAGITLDSSDVGRSGLQVKFFVWKRVCTNGLVIAKSSARLFKQKHIGITHEDFAEGLKEGLETFHTLKDKIAESIRETSKIPVNQDIDELLEEIKDKTNLSDQAAEKVVELMQIKYAPTKWGLINGITEVAQEFTLETRLQLEEIAGSMLA